jgi:hypothetical protein
VVKISIRLLATLPLHMRSQREAALDARVELLHGLLGLGHVCSTGILHPYELIAAVL